MPDTPDVAGITTAIADRLDTVVTAIYDLSGTINSIAFTAQSFGDSRRTQHQRIHQYTVEAYHLVKDAADDVATASRKARDYVDSLAP